MLNIEKPPYNTIVWCYKDPIQPPTYLHVQCPLLCTSSSAVGGSFNLHTSEFKYEIERKDWWARTKCTSLLQWTGGKNVPLHESLCVLQKRSVGMFQLCCAKWITSFIASVWHRLDTLNIDPSEVFVYPIQHFPPQSSSENTIQRLHDFSIKHSARKQLESALQVAVVATPLRWAQLFLVPDDAE